MKESIIRLISEISEKDLRPSINLARPIYLQPEDSMLYRTYRVVVICGMLNTANGLSKYTIACIDFLLKNVGSQQLFIYEYFKGQKNQMTKLISHKMKITIDNDFNIIQYKSVPWDLRYNNMFMLLHSQGLICVKGTGKDIRISLSEKGKELFKDINEIFTEEINFLSTFGSSVIESRVREILTEVIPKTFWVENEKAQI